MGRGGIWWLFLIAVSLALPVWHTTTKTYVAPLPYAEVAKWKQMVINVGLSLICSCQPTV